MVPTGMPPTNAFEVPHAPPEALAAAPVGAWFFGAAPDVRGPIALPALRELVLGGRLPATTPVWTPGMASFFPASAVPAFASGGGGDQAALGLIVPVGPQSGSAIVAGYLAVFGVVIWPLGFFGALVGVFALKDLKAHPEKKGHGRAWTGIVLGGLETLLLVWVVVNSLTNR